MAILFNKNEAKQKRSNSKGLLLTALLHHSSGCFHLAI